MAASENKAQALKNSYVDGIIDELGGLSDPAVRMVIRENDLASIHSFPESGKVGVINDNDPGLYIHGNGKSYLGDTDPDYANPIEGGAPGERQLLNAPAEAQEGGENYLREMEQRMGGSGDLARLRPRSLEEFNKRNPSNRPPEKKKLRDNQSSTSGFDGSNLAGAMGMEQGQQASVDVNLMSGYIAKRNDGIARVRLHGPHGSIAFNSGSAGYPVRGGHGAETHNNLNSMGAHEALDTYRTMYFNNVNPHGQSGIQHF